MNFLNDKKNQPIIIGAFAAIILAVGVYFYLMTRPPQTDTAASSQTAAVDPAITPPVEPTTPAAPETPAPATQTAAVTPTPGMTGAPTTSGAAATTQPAGQTRPSEKFRPDPFAMLHPPVIHHPPPPPPEPIPYPTWLIVPRPAQKIEGGPDGPAADTTPRRMAGVLFGQTVSAILETGTETVVVRPGDLVENSTMRVEKIEPNRIVLKSVGTGKARYVIVKMAAGLAIPGAASGVTQVSTPTTPASGPPPVVNPPFTPGSNRPGQRIRT